MADLERAFLEIRANPTLREWMREKRITIIETRNDKGRTAFWTALCMARTGFQKDRWYGADIEFDGSEVYPITLPEAIAHFGEEAIVSGLRKALAEHKKVLKDEKQALTLKQEEIASGIRANEKASASIDEASAFLD